MAKGDNHIWQRATDGRGTLTALCGVKLKIDKETGDYETFKPTGEDCEDCLSVFNGPSLAMKEAAEHAAREAADEQKAAEEGSA